MKHLKPSNAEHHEFYHGSVTVNEFNFTGDSVLNDAEITISGRYPETGYAVNDISTALISVESGEGVIVQKDRDPTRLLAGDRILIKPSEPYAISALGKLAIRYIATPAWTPEQARIME